MRTVVLSTLLLALSSSSVATAQGGGQQPERKWGIAAALFISSSTEIAVSRSVSENVMWLLSTQVSWWNRDTKTEEGESMFDFEDVIIGEQTNFSVAASPEWRRYFSRSGAFALYAGVRPTLGYQRSTSETKLSETDTVSTAIRRHNSATFVGVSLSFGVEYSLTERIAVSVHLLPFRYTYTRGSIDDSRRGAGRSERNSKMRLNTHALSLNQNPAVFVRFYF
jgi:opacity protein-like surface antigen